MRLPLIILHVSAGITAMIAGAFSIAFRKGSPAHLRAGNIFVISMLMVSAAGSYLGFMKSEMDNFMGGIFAFYLVATAWATARRGESQTSKLDWLAPSVAIVFAAANIIWGIEILHGETAVKNQSPAGSYFFFGLLALLSAAGDVRMFFRGGLTGRPRMVRHIWRMCFAWFVATVSFFLGQQRLFPAWLRGSSILTVMAFLPLMLLTFWLVRVRFMDSFQSSRAAPEYAAQVVDERHR
ncbi:MAG TPA: hypothetical protein VHA14_18915 [Bryobacteraceae bacterium]|nr:hypothetical protein [Bryobacteraceae bacterium]